MTRVTTEDVLLSGYREPGRLHVFAPVANGDKLNFYGLAVAPEIRWIRESTNELVDLYQHYVPGSAKATALLLELAEEARALVRELLLESDVRENYRIEFVGGTSRAVEVALARTGRRQNVIISLVEHPSVMEVAKWFVSIAGAELCSLQFEPRDHFRCWQKQEDVLIGKILEALKGVQAAT